MITENHITEKVVTNIQYQPLGAASKPIRLCMKESVIMPTSKK
jgi:hypothetical protein